MSVLEYFLICIFFSSYAVKSEMPQKKYNVEILSIYLCDGSDSQSDFSLHLHYLDEETKAVDLSFSLEEELTLDWQLLLRIAQWNNGGWDEEYYKIDSSFCKAFDENVQKSWEILRNKLTPAIPDPCIIEPGTYEITNFELLKDDYDFPVLLPGRWKATGQLFDPTGIEMLCYIVEAEVN